MFCYRLIQEEKQNAELRAEELESRVKQRLPVNPYATLSSPPISGRITPKQLMHQQQQQQPTPAPPTFVKYNTLPANTSLSQYYQYNSVGPIASQVKKTLKEKLTLVSESWLRRMNFQIFFLNRNLHFECCSLFLIILGKN